jgi:Transposase zinc-binding domain
MTRPTLEVADILRAQGDRFLEWYRSSFGFQQLKAFRAILRCRTAALGGHRDACLRCGYQTITTRVEIGSVPSVKRKRVSAG